MIGLPLRILLGQRPAKALPTTGPWIEQHANGALDWIVRAHVAAGERGVSKGYNLVRRRWAPSYPETTGYTIPTLLNAGTALGRPELRRLALSLADYLLTSATSEGGVAHWVKTGAGPIVFDTGQVMFGWLAAHDVSGDERYLRAALRAGDWLVSVQDGSGSWKRHQHLGVEKVIDTRVAWALLKLHQLAPNERYLEAAERNLDWAIENQEQDGWFRKCAFVEGRDPFTHTIAYTAEGLFECGQLLDKSRYVDAARLTADALLARRRSDGNLPCTLGPAWQETSRSTCLTGDCQMGLLWLRLYGTTRDRAYLDAAEQIIRFVASTQILDSSNASIAGAVAGSWPLYGPYERLKYPNWAAKFLVDALLMLQRVKNEDRSSYYVG
jgi:uncharacterized protein YyaL (SSP411 family)